MNKAFKFLWDKFELFVRFIMGVLLKLAGINWKEKQWERFLQFVKFCMVGLSSAVVMYLSYYISYVLSDNYIFANCIGFIFSTTNSFIWNNLIAPVINVIIVTPLNYVLNKLWAFKRADG